MHGRRLERARGAADEQIASITSRVRKPAQRPERERRRGERLDHLTGADDDAAVVTIGDVADQQTQHHHREELNKADEPRSKALPVSS
jgi:hypothetical protein